MRVRTTLTGMHGMHACGVAVTQLLHVCICLPFVQTLPHHASRVPISKRAQRAESLTKNVKGAIVLTGARLFVWTRESERAGERERENISRPLKEGYPQR